MSPHCQKSCLAFGEAGPRRQQAGASRLLMIPSGPWAFKKCPEDSDARVWPDFLASDFGLSEIGFVLGLFFWGLKVLSFS